jgi:hypothetical protein
MIGQYLPNNNEKRYSVILPKISHPNQPLVAGRRRKVAYGAALVADKMQFGKNGSCAMVSCSECKLKDVQRGNWN